MKGKAKKKIKWANSEAKFLLREDIIGGVVTQGMKAREIYSMRPCYADFDYVNFRTNLRAMRLSVEKDLGRAEEDEKYFIHDMHYFGAMANDSWHRSEACQKLKEDMASGKCEGMKPMELYHTRLEYRAFPLKKFRNEIYHARTKLEKLKMIEHGTHPRFQRLKHNPHDKKVKSNEILP